MLPLSYNINDQLLPGQPHLKGNLAKVLKEILQALIFSPSLWIQCNMNLSEDLSYRTIDFLNLEGTIELMSPNPLILCCGNRLRQVYLESKKKLMAELGEVRTVAFVVCILVYGDGAPTKKQWQAGIPGRPHESKALLGANSPVHHPPSNTCPFLTPCSGPSSSLAVPSAVYQACPASTTKSIFLSVTFFDCSSSHASLSLGLCHNLGLCHAS